MFGFLPGIYFRPHCDDLDGHHQHLFDAPFSCSFCFALFLFYFLPLRISDYFTFPGRNTTAAVAERARHQRKNKKFSLQHNQKDEAGSLADNDDESLSNVDICHDRPRPPSVSATSVASLVASSSCGSPLFDLSEQASSSPFVSLSIPTTITLPSVGSPENYQRHGSLEGKLGDELPEAYYGQANHPVDEKELDEGEISVAVAGLSQEDSTPDQYSLQVRVDAEPGQPSHNDHLAQNQPSTSLNAQTFVGWRDGPQYIQEVPALIPKYVPPHRRQQINGGNASPGLAAAARTGEQRPRRSQAELRQHIPNPPSFMNSGGAHVRLYF